MKKITRTFTILSIVFLMTQSVIAQPAITLEAFGGWLWTGSAGYDGSIKVDDKGNYGLRAGVAPKPGMVVEFEWNHSDTKMSWNGIGVTDDSEDIALNYYLLGFNMEKSEGPAIPYGLFNVGVLNVKGQDTNFSENWFTVGLGGGLKYYLPLFSRPAAYFWVT